MSFPIKTMEQAEDFMGREPFIYLKEELNEALSLYWTRAAQILKGSEIKVLDPSPGYFSINRNFFSSLFLYSYFRAGISKSRRIFYAAINQCLRGMVTGCDNILDDEYKKTLDTDLPEQGTRFRSVLDIMTSDRVLFSILYKNSRENLITSDQVLEASSESLRALTGSGAQEAAEQGGAGRVLPPEKVLSSVHHYKTARLFQCPWAVPAVIEKRLAENVPILKDALYQIGMGCQILDDMVDLSMDLQMNRHNYVISLIRYGANAKERDCLDTGHQLDKKWEADPDFLLQFPDAMKSAGATALSYLKTGAGNLFADAHQFMVAPSIIFIVRQIRADRFLPNIKLDDHDDSRVLD